MSVDFNYPYQIAANTPAVASEVQTNFNDLLTWIKTNYRQIDDTPNLTVVPVMPADPTIPSHAVNKAYADSIVPTGTVYSFAGSTLPDGYLFCDGQSYSDTGQYQDLFNVIGTSYGGGSGSFNVPDLQAKVQVGRTNAAGDFDTLGNSGTQSDWLLLEHVHNISAYSHSASSGTTGSTHTHNVTGSGSHDHPYNRLNFSGGQVVLGAGVQFVGSFSASTSSASHTHGTGTTGSTHTHNVTVNQHAAKDTATTGDTASGTNKNYPPYVVLNYIIKT